MVGTKCHRGSGIGGETCPQEEGCVAVFWASECAVFIRRKLLASQTACAVGKEDTKELCLIACTRNIFKVCGLNCWPLVDTGVHIATGRCSLVSPNYFRGHLTLPGIRLQRCCQAPKGLPASWLNRATGALRSVGLQSVRFGPFRMPVWNDEREGTFLVAVPFLFVSHPFTHPLSQIWFCMCME